MRLWHKDLISVLPKQQLVGQWRECCCIAKNIAEKGTPNHLLVNKITDYPSDHFLRYGAEVYEEMVRRGYKCEAWRFVQHFMDCNDFCANRVSHDDLFYLWHDDGYFIQCFYNLQEKYDCGGISRAEWTKVLELYFRKKKGGL